MGTDRILRRGRRGAVVWLAVLAAVAAILGAPGRALADAPTGKDGSGAGLEACIAEATTSRMASWTCMGGELKGTTVVGGETRVVQRTVAADFQVTPTPAVRVSGDDVVPLADDYDSWCENGSICARKISDYIAEVKGNGAYGDANGVIGTMDLIYRQNFNGQYPRWRSLVIWDSGPTLTFNTFYNDCRINVTGPDGYCGSNPVYFGNVSSVTWRSWWPSSTGLDQQSTRLTASSNYHDDNYGSFHAAGYGQTFYAGVLHTGRWNRCNASPYCRYYQVPWVA